MKTDSQGNVFLLSNFSGVMDVDPSEGVQTETSLNQDCLIQKFDSNGNFIWAHAFGNVGNDIPLHLAIDNNDDIIIVGLYRSTTDFDFGPDIFELTPNGNNEDGFVLKIDNQGNFIWAIGFGGEEYDEPSSVIVDSNNNITISGNFEGTCDFDPGPEEFNLTSGLVGGNHFVWKLDPLGNLLWVHQTGGFFTEDLNDMELDTDDHIIVGGYFSNFQVDFDPGPNEFVLSAQAAKDACIIKYDENGEFLWVYYFGTAGDNQIMEIEVTDDNEILFLGTFFGTLDLDPGPGVIEANSIGSTGLIIGKLNSDGNLLWHRIIDGEDIIFAGDMELTPTENIEIVGTFFGTLDFDPGILEMELTSEGSADPFFLSLDSNGDFIDINTFGSSSYEYIDHMHIDDDGNLYHAGTFRETVDMDPSEEVVNITSTGSANAYFRKLNPAFDFCLGDVNVDGEINVLDLLAVSSNFGCQGSCEGDANLDTSVDILDILLVSSNFGLICN